MKTLCDKKTVWKILGMICAGLMLDYSAYATTIPLVNANEEFIGWSVICPSNDQCATHYAPDFRMNIILSNPEQPYVVKFTESQDEQDHATKNGNFGLRTLDTLIDVRNNMTGFDITSLTISLIDLNTPAPYNSKSHPSVAHFHDANIGAGANVGPNCGDRATCAFTVISSNELIVPGDYLHIGDWCDPTLQIGCTFGIHQYEVPGTNDNPGENRDFELVVSAQVKSVASVPLPGTFFLSLIGLIALIAQRYKRMTARPPLRSH